LYHFVPVSRIFCDTLSQIWVRDEVFTLGIGHRMALKVITESTNIDVVNRKGTVVIEADTYDEAAGGEPVRLALGAAATGGLTNSGISSKSSPYAVQSDGKSILDVSQGMPINHKWRVDVKVLATT